MSNDSFLVVDLEANVTTVICIDDSFYLYFMDAIVVTLLYFVSFVIRDAGPLPRKTIIALQTSLALNLMLMVVAHITPVVSLLWIAAVFVGVLAMYSLAASYALMLVIGSLLSITFIALQSFALAWTKDALGLNALNDTQIYLILTILTITALVLVFLAERSKALGFILDSFILAGMLWMAFKFFAWLLEQQWPTRPWLNDLQQLQDTGDRNLTALDIDLQEGGPSRFCCDDNEIPCPVWFDPSDVLFISLLGSARVLYGWYADALDKYYERKALEQKGQLAAEKLRRARGRVTTTNKEEEKQPLLRGARV
jgi:hypothetical protein